MIDYRKKNLKQSDDYKKKWRIENKEKHSAHRKIEVAIRDGRMSKKPCGKCGNIKSHAHHSDYSRPLDVVWLCVRHHKEVHKT